MAKVQSVRNKIGEVEYRKKIAQQFSGKKVFYSDEPSQEEFLEIIKDRVNNYRKYFDKLKKENVLKSPYLELGAGVGQAAMLLENNYNLQGFTSDISYETLTLAKKFKKAPLNKKMPVIICCDIYNLPFRTKSIPFIFTFQTVHHFPDPLPIFKEIKRVMAPGGYFYFNEEPISQRFNLNLWRRRTHLRWFEKILKYLIVLHFITRIGKSESEHNILEETFSLPMWEKALNIFTKAKVNLNTFPIGPSMERIKTRKKGWINGFVLKRLLLEIMGGGIEATCQNTNGTKKQKTQKTTSLFDYLACPNCKSKPPLYIKTEKKAYICKRCNSIFKTKNGILMLLSNKQKKLLYPNF